MVRSEPSGWRANEPDGACCQFRSDSAVPSKIGWYPVWPGLPIGERDGRAGEHAGLPCGDHPVGLQRAGDRGDVADEALVVGPRALVVDQVVDRAAPAGLAVGHPGVRVAEPHRDSGRRSISQPTVTVVCVVAVSPSSYVTVSFAVYVPARG